MQNQSNIFDEELIKCRQERAKAQGFVSFLHDQVIVDLKNRINEQKQEFLSIEIIGPFARYWGHSLPYKTYNFCEDTNILTIKPKSRDLIISALYLHLVNDPIARLVQMRLGLTRQGILFAYAFGENSLYELKRSFEYAELKVLGKVSRRVNPKIDIPTFGKLLRRAGFDHCVSDKLNYTVDYSDPMNLLSDIRGMGETNAMIERSRRPLPKRVLSHAMEYYRENYKTLKKNNKYQATFDVVCLTGWSSKPGSMQE